MAGRFLGSFVVAEFLVQREADRLDGDVGRAWCLQEGAKDTSWDIAAAANAREVSWG